MAASHTLQSFLREETTMSGSNLGTRYERSLVCLTKMLSWMYLAGKETKRSIRNAHEVWSKEHKSDSRQSPNELRKTMFKYHNSLVERRRTHREAKFMSSFATIFGSVSDPFPNQVASTIHVFGD